jgi:hypothetical protein
MTPGRLRESTDIPHCGSERHGWHIPVSGIMSTKTIPLDELLRLMCEVISDTKELLAFTVLPRLETAFDVAEFAELLWLAEMALNENNLGTRCGAESEMRGGFATCMELEPKEILYHFVEVLCDRTQDITNHALPKAQPEHAADLAELLAVADTLYAQTTAICLRRAERERRKFGGELEAQAWELRARAWMDLDAWRYSCSGRGRTDYSALTPKSFPAAQEVHP